MKKCFKWITFKKVKVKSALRVNKLDYGKLERGFKANF